MPRRLDVSIGAASWLALCVLLTYAPSLGRGLVADDFGWIYFSRLDGLADAWRLLVEGAPGFYRPIVALSFGVTEPLAGLNPVPYAVTNLALAAGIAAAIVWLGTRLGLPVPAGLFGAGLWLLNFHGISTALLWASGRTSLLTTIFAVLAAAALARGRSLAAGLSTLAALLSKEEPVLLPAVFVLWLWIDGVPAAAILRRTWPSFVALGAYLALRARTDAFTPATAPSFYRLSPSPEVVLPNALSYLDRSMTLTAAVLLIAFAVFARARPRPTVDERRAAMKGLAWLALGFGVTILIPVRSSLYVVYPSVGSALVGMAIGSALWRAVPHERRRPALAALLLLPILTLPIHWLRHQAIRRQAILSTRVLDEARQALSATPTASRIVVFDDGPGQTTAAAAFGSELARAMEMVAGRPIPTELVQYDPQAAARAAANPQTIAIRVVDGGAGVIE